jgi:hypothetical protein
MRTSKQSKAVPLRNSGAKGDKSSSCYSLLTSALDGGEWLVSRPGRAYPRERTPGIHWIGGWVLRAGLDTETRGKKSFASDGDGIPVVQPAISHYTDWATPAHKA